MATDTPISINKKSQEGLIEFYKQCQNMFIKNWNFRDEMERIDKEYMREVNESIEHNRAKLANKLGNKSKFQDITVPIVLPQVEAAVTYQSSVFLTGVPIFGVSASSAFIDQALAMEALIDHQAQVGGWTRQFPLFFRDGFKYNLSAIEVSWDKKITAAIDTDLNFSASQGKPVEVIWEGNKVKRINMYNAFFDYRVDPGDMFEQGDFFGYTESYTRTRLKTLLNSLTNVRKENVSNAFSSTSPGGDYAFYTPEINPRSFLDIQDRTGMNWMAWVELAGSDVRFKYKDNYDVTTLYARIIPEDFGLIVPAKSTPQVWKFIIVNHSVLVYSERQTNAHGYLPILMGQPLEDGLGYQTKSLADNVLPIQDITSALSNSVIAARRRALSDRVLYDPSRITSEQINNPNPSAKIPVRPSAFGKNVQEAVYQFPFRDDQSMIASQFMQTYSSMANMVSGQNPVRQGQFVKGNKTQDEFNDVMMNANGRDQITAIGYETQVFAPLKHILLMNNLQYQGGTSIYSRAQEDAVKIDPVELRKAVYTFKVSDGLIPTSKLMDSDTTMVAMQQIGSSPQLAAEYNLGGLFSYIMKQKGAHIAEFEKPQEQKMYEQAMAQWQQTCVQLAKQNPNITSDKFPAQPIPQNYGLDASGKVIDKTQQSPSQPQVTSTLQKKA